MTLPLIHLYSAGDPAAQALIRRVMDARAVSLDEWHDIRALLAQSRSLEYARGVAFEFVERAKKALNAFPPSDARDALLYLPDYVIARDR
jgi:octaprenyl-diphosphate synthase